MAHVFVWAISFAVNLAGRGVDASVGAEKADRWDS